MIRKIGVLGFSLLCFAAITSCEKDFSEVGTNIVNNDKFETGEILLDVEITPIDIENVQTDNINASISEYWLGVYNNPNAEKIEASIVSQIGYVSGLKIQDNDKSGDTIFSLDKVILKLPYQATADGTENGLTTYKLDSILGNPEVATSIQVFENETYLNTLDPTNPSKANTFFSNDEYLGDNDLTEEGPYLFLPKAKDTIYKFQRIDRSSSLTSDIYYEDTTRVYNSQNSQIPFLAIPLDLTKMKSLFWDKFESNEFTSKEIFDDYFRGIKIVASGNDGSMAPFNLATSPTPSIDFYYTKSIVDGTTVNDTLQRKYTFPLSGVRNSVYKMTAATNAAPTNSFVIQGTAGSAAEIKILDDTKLQELRNQKLLINDVSLTFYVDQDVNTDKNLLPQQLFLYQNKENDAGVISPTQLSDAYNETTTYGGGLSLTEDEETPEKYKFRITDYFTRLLNGEEGVTVEPLILKVYNTTDAPSSTTDVNVRAYNWNPRSVMLLNGNEAAHGEKRAVLKILYSTEK